MPVNTIITVRKGTNSQWNSTNPVLGSGEPGYDLTNNILKIGDGVSNWNSLSNHKHSVIDITNFNSSVSGLLPTIANSGDNRILTSTGTTTGINAENNATFDGTNFNITGIFNIDNLRIDGNTISSTTGNIILNPSSTGALQRDAGGNSRGQYSVDLQTTRSTATQVASGNYSIIGGGSNNTANGSYSSILGGQNNTTNSQSNTHIIGSNITADSPDTAYVEKFRTTKAYSEKVSAVSISGGTLTIDLNNANLFTCTLNANITTLTISNTPSSSGVSISFTIIFTADGTARTITWPASIKWPGGTAPTLTSTNGKIDVLSFVSVNQGSSWLGFVGGQNF